MSFTYVSVATKYLLSFNQCVSIIITAAALATVLFAFETPMLGYLKYQIAGLGCFGCGMNAKHNDSVLSYAIQL